LTRLSQGPIAVPAKDLPEILRVQTHVNGELRQNATTEDLIFSIPFLIKTLSEGMTIQPGDVIATGTVSFFVHNARCPRANIDLSPLVLALAENLLYS
jgi:2-keto-4-pentenoate hydratase/2-oxohepta-3-ene-1,7-dioic acid hydratase in catechol pathway